MSIFRGRLFGFEIQHLFPNEILTRATPQASAARNLLASIGFDLDARSNKMPLLINPFTRDVLAAAGDTVKQAFTAAGFGWNWHDS